MSTTTTNRPVPGQVEDRDRPTTGDLEQRAAPSAAPTLDGRRLHGRIPYRTESRDLGGWREVLEPGCLAGARMDDLIATVDHGGVPIGRSPGTLTVEQRDDGLAWSVDLPESRADVREAVQRGDLCAGSWRMVVGRDEWRGDVRHIHEVAELRDVSVVSSPAYSASTVEYRSQPQQAQAQRPAAPPAGPTPGPGQRTGGLRAEDRSGDAPTIAQRVEDAMRGVPRGENRSLTAAANAAPVTPEEQGTLVWDRLRDRAVVLAAGARVITTARNSVKWPRITSDVAAAFYDELDEIVPSDPGLDEIEAIPRAIKALVRGSSEAFDDSSPDLLQLLNAHLTAVMALRLDRALLVGGDAKGFTGLLGLAGVPEIDAGGSMVNYDVLTRAAGLLAANNAPGPFVAFAHPYVTTALGLLKTGESGSEATLPAPAGTPPIRTSSAIPITAGIAPAVDTSTIIVAAMPEVAVVRRADVQLEVDRSEEFSSDAVLVRSKLRATLLVPHAPKVLVKITGVPAPDPTV